MDDDGNHKGIDKTAHGRGRGIHPRCVTSLEIKKMMIELVKWHVIADPGDGRRLKVVQEPLGGSLADLMDIFVSL